MRVAAAVQFRQLYARLPWCLPRSEGIRTAPLTGVACPARRLLGMLVRPASKHAHANSGVGMPPGKGKKPPMTHYAF